MSEYEHLEIIDDSDECSSSCSECEYCYYCNAELNFEDTGFYGWEADRRYCSECWEAGRNE